MDSLLLIQFSVILCFCSVVGSFIDGLRALPINDKSVCILRLGTQQNQTYKPYDFIKIKSKQYHAFLSKKCVLGVRPEKPEAMFISQLNRLNHIGV